MELKLDVVLRVSILLLFFVAAPLYGAVPAEPAFDDITKAFKNAQPSTVAEGLQTIYNQYPLFFNGYTLAYSSHSLQQSSPLNPRAIVFGDKARLILTFNGDKSQAGYGSIELVHFSSQGEPEYREIRFSQEDSTPLLQVDQNLSGHGFHVSTGNPDRCLGCHGVGGIVHPLWETYPLWPGIYGSEDDNVYRPPYISLNRFMNVLGHDSERENLTTFSEVIKSDEPRYHFLGEMNRHPNRHLTGRLFYFAGEHYAEKFLNNSNLSPYRFLAMAQLLCRDPVSNLMPPQLFAWHTHVATLNQIRTEQINSGMKQNIEKIGLFQIDYGSPIYPDNDQGRKQVAQETYNPPPFSLTVLEWIGRPYQVSLNSFSTTRTRVADFSTGNSPDGFLAGFYSVLAKNLKKSMTYKNLSPTFMAARISESPCHQLKTDSLHALKKWPQKPKSH